MTYRPDSEVKWITLHYTATLIENEYTFDQLEADHLARGFKEAGYHVFITRDRPGKAARVIYGRDLSFPGMFEQGAHSRGENDESVSICYEGGLSRSNPKGHNTMTETQKRLMIVELRKLTQRYLDAEVEGHKDMPGAATECPGFNAAHWWETNKDRYRQPLPVSRAIRSRPWWRGRLRELFRRAA